MWTWQQKQKKIYPEVHKPQLPVLHLVPCNTVCWRTAKIHLQEESVCKQVISDYHAGKVHLELLQGKRACTLCVFNAQVSRIISTSVLQQHLHPTITWKWLHAVNLGKKNWWLSIPIRFTRQSLRQRGGGKQYTMQKNSLYNVDLARYQKTCEKNTGQNCHQQWHSMYRLHSASKALQKPWEVKTPQFSLSLKCWICHKIHQ
jgi:hypothetical protein